MTRDFWLNQISRLKEHFGEKRYGRDFADAVFKEINQEPVQSDSFVEKMVTNAITGERFAPLAPYFLEAIKSEKRRVHEFSDWLDSEKKPTNGYKPVGLDIPEFMGMFSKYMTGKITKQEFDNYGKIIKAAIREKNPGFCEYCAGTGELAHPTANKTLCCSCPDGIALYKKTMDLVERQGLVRNV